MRKLFVAAALLGAGFSSSIASASAPVIRGAFAKDIFDVGCALTPECGSTADVLGACYYSRGGGKMRLKYCTILDVVDSPLREELGAYALRSGIEPYRVTEGHYVINFGVYCRKGGGEYVCRVGR